MTRKNRLPMLFAAGSALALAIACNSSENPGSDGAAKADAAKPAVTQAMIDRGAQIYKANCIACHGEGGKGDGPAAGVLKPPPRDHTDRAYMDTLTDDDLKKVIVMGGAIKGRPLMPSHPQLRGDDLDALVAFVRSLSTGTKG
jgi:mono/diheme cytochrome c family protein